MLMSTFWRSTLGLRSLVALRNMSPDYYATLGLGRRCNAGQIRDAYRIFAKRFHPDLNPGSAEAVARTQEINAAYEVLSDPDRRRIYDESLAAEAKAKRAPRAGIPQQNISQDVHLRLDEFFRGTTLEVRVNDPGNPDGPEVYPLQIPPETAPGARVRVRREGTFSGSQVLVRVRARPDFRF